ncbi:MAG: electron transfer flavoprotein subunit beta/FixA family protein [bacterium]
MKIIVCIKQVPDTSEVKIDPQTNTLIREGVASIINPFDKYALEAGLQLKEKYGGYVWALTMGPPQAEAVLREALGMGADEAALLSDRALAGSDTWATSRALTAAIKKLGSFDLILCGKQAIDGDTAQVGPELGESLGIAQAAYVRKITPEAGDSKRIKIERMLEDGYESIELELPALLTVVKEANEPRHASLKGVLKAKKAKIPVWGIQDLGLSADQVGLSGSPTQVIKVFTPSRQGTSEMLEGEPEEVVNQLVERLKGQGLLTHSV